MESKIRVGIFTPNEERPWVREANQEIVLGFEQMLINQLSNAGVEVYRGGEGLPREEQTAWNTQLVRKHIKNLAKHKLDMIILNQGDWTWPYDSRDAVQMFANELEGINKGMARVLIYCYKAPEAPGLVAGMAIGGALRRVGIPYKLVFGKIDQEPAVIQEIISILKFYKKRSDSSQDVVDAIESLKGKKYLAVGGMALKMCTGTADVDQWAKLFGLTYDALDQSELTRRASSMVEWEGKPGKSKIIKIHDPRVAKALNYTFEEGHGYFDFTREKLSSIEIYVYQLAYYYAAMDVLNQHNGDFMGIKCQDELSGLECTQCIAAGYLNNDVGPDGEIKETVPVACENDMDSSLTQMILKLLNGGKPAGFGDFRDIEEGVLAIVNCGQHPPYFFGAPCEDSVKKLDKVEYYGQEIFYHAGGATIRGRTPGGEEMTVVRLHRENLRYSIVAMAVKTKAVPKNVHERYSISWPVIWAKTPISDRDVIDLWPCNHLGFTYGDYTAEIVELAERLGIGYTVYDRDGNVYKNFS